MITKDRITRRNFDDYRTYKTEYFSLVSTGKLPRGKSRAYIGARTQVDEADLIKSGYSEDEAHVIAFSDAVTALKAINDRDELESKLMSSTVEWRALRKTMETLCEDSISDGEWIPPKPAVGKAISLFSGAMGLDLGFIENGVQIVLGNDIEKESAKTVASNLPNLKFLNRDIDSIELEELMREAEVSPGEVDILIGGPPCQPFSPAGRRGGLNDPRASPLKYFIRAIMGIKPAAFVMEEVPGLLSSRLKHFPYYEKYNRKPEGDEERGSAFTVIKEMLDTTGYRYAYAVLNAADFGAPQIRSRLMFIGLREGTPSFPEPTHSGKGLEERHPWVTFWESANNLRYTKDKVLKPEDRRFMSFVPPGGNWGHMPPDVASEAMGNAIHSEGGRMGFYRRIAWDEPSPTLVTTPSQKGTFLVHPQYDRFLSLAEYKVLQGFPPEWKITGGVDARYRLIGNAVPVHLSMAVAKHVLRILNGEV